jgi:hypothetical protein
MGSYKHDNELLVSIKDGELLDYLSDYQLIRKYSAACSWFDS